MNMSASTKNDITLEFRTFRTDSQLTTCLIFLIIVGNGYFVGTVIGTKVQNNAFGSTLIVQAINGFSLTERVYT